MSFYGKKTVRQFLTGSSYDEPVYMGFKIEFVFNDIEPVSNNLLPHGLLHDSETDAYQFLQNQSQGRRSKLLKEFRGELKNIQNDQPWIWTEVSGLGEIYKINPADSYRGKDKVISIKYAETLDNKMAYVLDLYRKIAFDAVNMKWILPDIMRFFKLNIYISEIRSFHQPEKKNAKSELDNIKAENKSIGRIATQYSEYGSQIASNWNETKERLYNKNSIPSTADLMKAAHFIQYLDAQTSILKFELSECEFDINTFTLSALETATTNPETATTGSFNIKVGHIRESNLWSLWDLFISDTNVNSNNIELPYSANSEDMHLSNRGDPDQVNAVYSASPYLKGGLGDGNGAVRHLGETPSIGSSITENLLNDLEDIVTSRVGDALEETIKKPLLGNVYGFSLLQTAALLQGGLSGVITTVQQMNNTSGNSGVGDNILTNVYDSFEENDPKPIQPKNVTLESENIPIESVKDSDHAETATDESNPSLGNVGFTGEPTRNRSLSNEGG